VSHFTRYNHEAKNGRAEEDLRLSNTSALVPKDTDCHVEPIRQHEVERAIKSSKNTAPGHDGIPNVFFFKLPQECLTDLLSLYNSSLFSANVPWSWKLGVWIPILKPGKDPTLVQSSRPICKLSCVGKLMERIVKNRIEYDLERGDKLRGEQDGFRRGRSTMDSLLKIKHFIDVTFNRGEFCAVVYLDLEGAYDGVWHQGLLHKLLTIGIHKDYVRWIQDYLKDRRGKVSLGVSESSVMPITCGLPQGAVLSPLLFNVMLFDIPVAEEVQLAIYADDITIMCRGTTRDGLRRTLQDYLDMLMNWLTEWKFKVNPTKCSQQIFTRRRLVPDVILRINNTALNAVREQRVLGMIFDAPKLNFAKHVDALKIEGKKRLNFLRAISSAKWGADRNLLRQVYVSFVRSKLEYGSILFGELPQATLRKLEVLQNVGLRCILGARKTSPILSMEVESYIPPIGLRFRYLTAKWYIKLMHRNATVEILGLNTRSAPGTFGFRATTVLSLMHMPTVQRTPTDTI
jgi:hypothetical protein